MTSEEDHRQSERKRLLEQYNKIKQELITKLVEEPVYLEEYTKTLNKTLAQYQEFLEDNGERQSIYHEKVELYCRYKDGKMSEQEQEDYLDSFRTDPSEEILPLVRELAETESKEVDLLKTIIWARDCLGFNIMTEETAKKEGVWRNTAKPFWSQDQFHQTGNGTVQP